MKRTIIVIAIIIAAVLLTYGIGAALVKIADYFLINHSYSAEANWDSSNERFLEYYQPLYKGKIEELKGKYSIECEEKFTNEPSGAAWEALKWYLYNEEFTIKLYMYSSGDIDVSLYYYGKDELTYEYEDYAYLVEFLNDFICYVSYDAKKDCNYFKVLYDKSKAEGKTYIREVFHHDSAVGSLYYYVTNERDESGDYYYMAAFDSSVKKTNYTVEFSGLLQPID